MRTYLIVQHDDGTPTGSRSTSFFIPGILGPDTWSIFMRWLRRLAERFSVAASLVGHPGDGWRFRPGCSIGRPERSAHQCTSIRSVLRPALRRGAAAAMPGVARRDAPYADEADGPPDLGSRRRRPRSGTGGDAS